LDKYFRHTSLVNQIRFLFAYNESMFPTPNLGLYPFVIACKGCHENIPAPVETLPDDWIIAACPLCGLKRRYLPAEIFQGKLSHQVAVQRVRGVR
jgi:hypothetical protein